ncbi:MAG TPA: tetratricopeptide repeat protein [Thermoanaerobaculia bacterium]|nr:tetratricopeptide repeat protein [Thermoanaerobaculia bacterium]
MTETNPRLPAPAGALDAPLAPEILARFLQRIDELLDAKPYEPPSAEHRAQLAALLAEAGGRTHYELLGLPVGAAAGEVAGAFEELARRVHPRHAARLGLGERRDLLLMLFERATRAYLVLSDPQRRSRYDRALDLHPEPEARSPEEVAGARRQMAREYFERARGLARSEEYHYAVELLRDAVRWDPRPEYLALLGEIEGRNPKWLERAAEHLERAVRSRPDEGDFRLQLAQVYDRQGRVERAVAAYREALERLPGNEEASKALERLGGGDAKGRGWLGRRRG